MRKIIFLLLILIFSFCGTSFCDTVVLKTGRKIHGRIEEKTDEYVKIDFNGMPVYYDLKYVSYCIFDKDLQAQAQKQEQDPAYYLNKSIEYIARGDFENARKELHKGIDANQSAGDLHANLKVIDDLDNNAVPRDYVIALYKGLFYITTKQFQLSLAELQKAAAIGPKQPDVYYHLGIACYSLGSKEDAIKYFQKALNLRPDDIEAMCDLGYIYYSQGKYDDCIYYLQKALQLDPNYPDASYLIGLAKSKSGN